MAPRRGAPALAALCTAALVLVSTSAFGGRPVRPATPVPRPPHAPLHDLLPSGRGAAGARLAGIAERVRTDLAARTGIAAPVAHARRAGRPERHRQRLVHAVPLQPDRGGRDPAAAASFLGHHDDWLRIVFTHEYTHILHLDRVGGWMRGFRWLMGRSPAIVPEPVRAAVAGRGVRDLGRKRPDRFRPRARGGCPRRRRIGLGYRARDDRSRQRRHGGVALRAHAVLPGGRVRPSHRRALLIGGARRPVEGDGPAPAVPRRSSPPEGAGHFGWRPVEVRLRHPGLFGKPLLVRERGGSRTRDSPSAARASFAG